MPLSSSFYVTEQNTPTAPKQSLRSVHREQPRSLSESDTTHYSFSDGGSGGVLLIGLLTGVTRRSQGRSNSRCGSEAHTGLSGVSLSSGRFCLPRGCSRLPLLPEFPQLPGEWTDWCSLPSSSGGVQALSLPGCDWVEPEAISRSGPQACRRSQACP